MRLLAFFILIFGLKSMSAQSNNLPCDDGDFESNNMNTWGWNMMGYCRTRLSANPPTFLSITPSIPTIASGNLSASISGIINYSESASYLWEIVNSGFDPNLGGTVLPRSRSGRALKIGGNGGSYAVESIRKSFMVTEGKRFINFWYAIVFYSPHHNNDHNSPFFGVRVNNQFVRIRPTFGLPANPIVQWSNNHYPLNNGINGYKYREWTCASIDLSNYEGQVVDLDFIVGDCFSGNPDRAYVYLDDISCSNHNSCNLCCIEDTIYSSSKYGYNRSLPTIVANNAKYHEIEFCSFEENNFVLPATSVGAEIQYDGIMPNNITFASHPSSTGVCITDIAHTGKKSLQVLSANNPSYSVKIAPLDNSNAGLMKDVNHFITIPQSAIEPQFNLLGAKKYRMKLWIKSTVSNSSVNNYVTIQMKKADGTTIVSNSAGSFVTDPIEGWRLYEIVIPSINSDTREMTLQFHGGDADETRFYDDVRIIPEDALAKSYVYHEKSLKLISELDENHFATFYDYDEAGNLIRVRKETERGVVTLKEASVNYQKKR
jgi:hypothetical protein